MMITKQLFFILVMGMNFLLYAATDPTAPAAPTAPADPAAPAAPTTPAAPTAPAPPAAPTTKPKEYTVFKGQTTKIKEPFKLRDPFKRKNLRSAGPKSKVVTSKGALTDRFSIEDASLDSIKVIGILLGEKRRAIAKVKGRTDQTFILKEGMRLGSDKVELKAILPGGIVLVEKFRNIYNQDEYLETVIPVSKND